MNVANIFFIIKGLFRNTVFAENLERSIDFLKERHVTPYNFLKNGSGQPTVFTRIPFITVYLDDPDGHTFELIARQNTSPRPELGAISKIDCLKTD
ncbi:MAG: hypothetical protein IPL84_12750 [Chitinophagaceae bacterium]|nr:hypothetical protein [Chitinophagaceae bacterium]